MIVRNVTSDQLKAYRANSLKPWTLVAYTYCRITWSVMNSLCVTRFAKRVLYMHSFKTHFLPLFVNYINGPTAHVFNTTEAWTVCFHSGLFLKPVWCPQALGWTSKIPHLSLESRQLTESPHTCLMSFSMDLAALCDMWRWKWHQCKSLGCF